MVSLKSTCTHNHTLMHMDIRNRDSITRDRGPVQVVFVQLAQPHLMWDMILLSLLECLAVLVVSRGGIHQNNLQSKYFLLAQ